VTQQQRDLINGQSSELSALVSWQNAKISLDQNIGVTLEANHVLMKDAETGTVARPSSLPAALPATLPSRN
jgi:hypothetical protein